MPFRQNRDRKLLKKKRRTGEPSPAFDDLLVYSGLGEFGGGYGKARGSYTEKLRRSLWSWMEETYGNPMHPLTFEYRLYRRKRINVVGTYPFIKHEPAYGNGKKGFVLILTVESIDGIPYRGLGRRAYFAWDRIIGKEMFLALPEGKLSLEGGE